MRRAVLVATAVTAIAAGGTILNRGGSDSSDRAEIETAAEPTPVAYLRVDQAPTTDVDAAVEAAVTAVGLTDEVVTAGFISRRDLIGLFATEDYAPRLSEETSSQLGQLFVELGARDADPAEMALLEQPLAASGTADGGGVRVQVWSVLVVAAPGAGPARQVWRTVTLEMVLVEGRWLVDGWSSRLGPTPALPVEASLADPATAMVPLGWERVLGGDR